MPEIGRERLFPRSAPAKSRCRAQTYRVGTGRHFVRPRNSPFQPPFRTGSTKPPWSLGSLGTVPSVEFRYRGRRG
jgi:hypothetical protein